MAISSGPNMVEGSASAVKDELGEGFAYRKALRLGFAHPVETRAFLKILVLVFLTWAPPLALSLAAGHARGRGVSVPFLRDPQPHSRYLVALPLLVLAGGIVGTSLSVQTGFFIESGLIRPEDLPSYQWAKERLERLRGARAIDVALMLVAGGMVVLLRASFDIEGGATSWQQTGPGLSSATPAGWWSLCVCLPLLMFLFLRWIWRWGLWTWFLWRVSRLDLELTPTHPDRAGGLGFLAWSQASFAPVVAAVSAVLSGSFAREVIYNGESLQTLKYHLTMFVLLALAATLAPLLLFSGRLAQCRFQALLDFGMLAWHHNRAFDQKWIQATGTRQEELLGSADVSSLSDVASAFDRVQHMRVVPIDHQAVFVLAASAFAPMLPFLASTINFASVLTELGAFLL